MVDTTDSRTPFGTYAPSPFQSLLMAVGHRMPSTWLGRRVASLIRSVLRRWSERPVDAVRLGSRMRLHANGNASEKRLMTSPQFFDPDELAVLEKALTPGFTFIDIGANAGAYTLFVAHRVGSSGKVLAVEPHPTARQRLQCNLDLNGIDWVTIAPVAIADGQGVLSLFINDRNIGSSSLNADAEPEVAKRSIQVPCRTLLSLIQQEGIERIDAIKVDVEGVEDRVLVPLFINAPPDLWPHLLLIENNRSAWKDDLPAVLQRSGYVTVVANGSNLVLRREIPSLRNGAA